jgi:sigma-E factor negative regulatory protein RseA
MNETPMNPDVRENLSAGMDGELSGEQLRFLLRRLDHDASLQHAWSRYHVLGDGLRRQLPPLASAGFAERVMLALEREASAVAPVGRSHWLRWSAGGAIAASVAVAALMLGQPVGTPEPGFTRASAAAPAANAPVDVASADALSAPAAVPPWLSGNSAGLMSQQASATFGEPMSQGSMSQAQSLDAQHIIDSPQLHRYRMLNNHDGSYLLLLGQGQQASPADLRQPAAGGQ